MLKGLQRTFIQRNASEHLLYVYESLDDTILETFDTSDEETCLNHNDTAFRLPSHRKGKEESLSVNTTEKNAITRLYQPFLKLNRSSACKAEKQWDSVRNLLQDLGMKGKMKQAVDYVVGELELNFLHCVCMNRPPIDVVRTIVRASPSTLRMSNKCKMLPLHLACQYRASEVVIKYLVRQYNDAVNRRDALRRIPLHYAIDLNRNSDSLGAIIPAASNRRCSLPPPEVIRCLSCVQNIAMKGSDGLSPLDLLSRSLNSLLKCDMTVRTRVKELVYVLLDCEPYPKQMMTSLQSYPRWCLEPLLDHPYMKQTMAERSGHPLFASIYMADFAIQLLLIVAFTLGFKTISSVNPDGTTLAIIFASILYFLTRVGMRFVGFVYARRLQLWFLDFWNWLDVVDLLLLLLSTLLLLCRPGNFERYRGVVVITGGLQWLHLLSLLRAISMSFSVFITGVFCMLVDLFPFLVTTFLLLGSFAFMYFASNFDTDECEHYNPTHRNMEDKQLTHCSMSDSLLSVYAMFGGEIEERSFTTNRSTLTLTIVFAFLLIVLQLNVLIAVITDTYRRVKDRAANVFWMDRFYYLCSLESIRRVARVDQLSCRRMHITTTRSWRRIWNRLVLRFTGKAEMFEKNRAIRICGLIDRLGALIFLTLWCLAGVLTLGWLWPPQVREYLFCRHLLQTSREHAASPTNLIVLTEELQDLHEKVNTTLNKCRQLNTDWEQANSMQNKKFNQLNRKLDIIQTLLHGGGAQLNHGNENKFDNMA